MISSSTRLYIQLYLRFDPDSQRCRYDKIIPNTLPLVLLCAFRLIFTDVYSECFGASFR